MANLYRCFIGCFIYFISELSFSNTIFNNTNTVPIDSGAKARLIGVTSINSSARTAGVVIDARDRFGNKLRLVKTADFNPSKMRSYIQACLRNPVACTASAALSAALIYYGYTISSDGEIYVQGAGGSYPECIEKPVPFDNAAGVVSALGPIPCSTAPSWNGSVHVYTLNPLPANEHLLSMDTRNIYHYITDSQGLIGTVYDHHFGTSQTPSSDNEPITDQQLMDVALESPAHIQVQAGVYPDVFDPVEVPESATVEDIGTEPETDPETDPQSEYEPMIGMEAVPEQTIDIAGYFDWGSGWLPKQCPSPQVLANIKGQDFTFDYTTLCGLVTDYVSPFIRFIAIFSFLAIVIGGVRA